MSDIGQSVIIDKGGLLKGGDGKISLRKLMGSIFAIIGVISLILAQIQLAGKEVISSWDALLYVPGIFLIFACLYILKIITAQNIQAIAKSVKGKADE
jgi:hypothetical protein